MKEPNYYCPDRRGYRLISSWHDYRQLFAQSTSNHQWVGEASVWYLSSEVAPHLIARDAPSDARFLVMLRDPVQFTESIHRTLLLGQIEDESDLRAAWAKQDDRLNGRSLPVKCRAPELLQYRQLGAFATQLETWFSCVGRERILVNLLDDLQESPDAVYRRTLGFLEVPNDGRSEFPAINRRKRYRSDLVGAFLKEPPASLRSLRERLRRANALEGPAYARFAARAARSIVRANQVRDETPTLIDERLRREIRLAFAPEVERLAGLIHRDLSNWLP